MIFRLRTILATCGIASFAIMIGVSWYYIDATFAKFWMEIVPNHPLGGFSPSMEIVHITLGVGPDPIDLYIPKRYITFYDAPGTGSGFVNMTFSYEQLMARKYLDESGHYRAELTNISGKEDELLLQLQPGGAGLGESFEDSIELYKSIKMRDNYYELTVYKRNGRGPKFGTETGIYLRPNDRTAYPDTYMQQAVGFNPTYPCEEYSAIPNDMRMRVSFFFRHIAEWQELDRAVRQLVVQFSQVDHDARK
jgi:hypothetical protein